MENLNLHFKVLCSNLPARAKPELALGIFPGPCLRQSPAPRLLPSPARTRLVPLGSVVLSCLSPQPRDPPGAVFLLRATHERQRADSLAEIQMETAALCLPKPQSSPVPAWHRPPKTSWASHCIFGSTAPSAAPGSCSSRGNHPASRHPMSGTRRCQPGVGGGPVVPPTAPLLRRCSAR